MPVRAMMRDMTLSNKTIFISGASRGIGRAIALRCAQDGANIIIAAKTSDPHPKLPGTIHSVAAEIEEAGGKALDDQGRILDKVPASLHERSPYYVGTRHLVEALESCRLTPLSLP